MKAILIDDEKNSLETLRMELELNCPKVEILALCQGAHEGIDAIHSRRPDLVFLDIQMPEINGFELLRMVGDVDFEVIFVTAYDSYSMQAIKVSAMDYLLKPVDGDDLASAVGKVARNLSLKRSSEQVDFLLTNLQQENSTFSKIAPPTIKGFDFIDVDDIVHCVADGNYTSIQTVGGEEYIISRTLSDFEEMLSNQIFFRTHKSHLINLNYIKQYLKGSGGQVILKDGTSVQVARARKEMLLELIYSGR